MATTNERVSGTVTTWNQGYGFFSVPGNPERVFCHRSALPKGEYELVLGERVTFNLVNSPKGLRAEAVELDREVQR